MTGIPVSAGGPPTSNRSAIEAAMQPDPAAQGGPDDQAAEAQQLTEVESRIMRLEEALVSRGVLHDTDLQGPPVPAPGAPRDPNAPADPAAQGAPPAAPSGPPIQ